MIGAGMIDSGEGHGGSPGRRHSADPRYSQSLEHSARLLRCFTAERPTLRIAELADMIEMPRPTTHRYAQSLLVFGYLEQDDKRRYRLSNGPLRAGITMIETLRAETPAARTILEDLREQTGHTVSMAALGGIDAIYTLRLFAHGTGQHEADLELRVGAAVPAYCTAIGKALLASLSEPEQRELITNLTLKRKGPNTIMGKQALTNELVHIRADGIATCDEEQAAGVRSVAAAITHPGRSRPLAISITIPAQRYTVNKMVDLFADHVKAAAVRI